MSAITESPLTVANNKHAQHSTKHI